MEDETSLHSGRLQRWPVEYLEGVNVRDAEHLATVGLQARRVGTVDVMTPTRVRCGVDLVLARDGDVPIVVQRDVPSVVAREDGFTRPVNSTVEAFANCLATYEAYQHRVRLLDEEAALLLVGAVEANMRLIDAEVLADSESYWAVVLEQMRDGLL